MKRRTYPRTNHEAEVGPLAQEVAVDIYAVWLAQILGDERPYGREVPGLQVMLILDVSQRFERHSAFQVHDSV